MEIHTNYCSRCKTKDVALIKYSTKKNKKGEVRSYYHCRQCNKERYKKWYHDNPVKARAIIYANSKKHKDKTAARTLLNTALRANKITKPDACTGCHKKKALQAHHDDYTQPLKVAWLCTDCHADEHRKMVQ